MITHITNNTLTYCQFATNFSEFWMQTSVINVMTYTSNNAFWT